MLCELHISNLAVIEDAVVEFSPGLNVLTGPTGAGKSLVIGAIEILLGLRAPARLLRDGASEGRVTGVFDLAQSGRHERLSALLGMAIDNDELQVVRRVLASGRTTATVNAQPVPAATLKLLGERLIDIHGQYDNQFLLKPANQLALLDDNLKESRALAQSANGAFAAWREALARRDALRAGARQRAERLDLLEFQQRDLDDADPKPAELESVEARHRLLSQVDELRSTLTGIASALCEGEHPLADALSRQAARLHDAARIDSSLRQWADALSSAAVASREAGRDVAQHAESLDADPAELAALDARLATLRRLTARYGPTWDDVLLRQAAVANEIQVLRTATDESDACDESVSRAEKTFRKAAAALTSARQKAAAALSPAVASQLAELGLERAAFEIELRTAEPSCSGCDAVEFMVRTNPGQPLRPLREIASGGEMNRLMLALKSVAAGADRCSVLVFDEVDANVGGRMGSVIGRKLRGLSARHQVLCITHLPQIAAYADRHLRVDKVQGAEQTRTQVSVLEGEARVRELAEMIAGASANETTMAQSRDLLKEAASAKVERLPRKLRTESALPVNDSRRRAAARGKE